MPEKNEKLAEGAQPQPIERVELEKVNGLRRRIKELFRRVALVAGIGAASGGIAGEVGQHYYRDRMDYHPDQVAEAKVEPQAQPAKEAEKAKEKSYFQKAQETLSRARQVVGEAIEGSETVQQYRETKKELLELKQKLLEAGDKTAFWLPFVLTLLAASILANKMFQVKKSLSERIDPVIENNMERIEAKLNEIVDRVNALQPKGLLPEEQPKLAEEVQELATEFLAESESLDEKGEDPENPV